MCLYTALCLMYVKYTFVNYTQDYTEGLKGAQKYFQKGPMIQKKKMG